MEAHEPLVVAVCGSRRDGSYTRRALEYALDAAHTAGARTELLDLRTADVPLYDPDADVAEQGDVVEALALVREADGVVLGSPVYHGSYASTLKNFLDYCSFEEFEDTAVGLLAVAGGGSYGSTLEHMRTVVRGVHGHCVPEQVGIRRGYDQFDETGAFTDPELAERVADLAESVVDHARLYREERDSERERDDCEPDATAPSADD